jgi:hypothetical protein
MNGTWLRKVIKSMDIIKKEEQLNDYAETMDQSLVYMLINARQKTPKGCE